MGKLTKRELLCVVMTGLLLGAALGVAGSFDYEDEVERASEYNMMVCAGYWPDYENRKPECKK